VVLSPEPTHTEALYLLALCQAETGNMTEANKLIQAVISSDPSNPYYLYTQANFYLKDDRLKEAEKFVRNAIMFDPQNADFFGLLSIIKINQKEWTQALQYANDGLALDASNITCLNSRTTALFKLDKKDDAYTTIKEALHQDPENDTTHANIGWGLLEKGDHKQALEHFREALRLNPHSEYAKAGLVEGLKARYWFYRIFLRYAFWIGNFQKKGQWAIILGLYFGSRILSGVSNSNPELAVFLQPVVTLYILFALSTWIITPLSNLFLRLNVYGRYALSEEETSVSNFTGAFFLIGLTGLALMLFYPEEFLYQMLMYYGISMMVPLASMLNPAKKGKKMVLIGYAILLGVVGLLAMLNYANDGSGTLIPIYIYALLAYQFLANWLIMR
jgi:tetratricopeptide (TPR) repeat protein